MCFVLASSLRFTRRFHRTLACAAMVSLFVTATQCSAWSQEPAEPKPAKAAPKPANPAFVQIKDDPALPRVLLLGDSISIGYTVAVREKLKGIANVHRPATNCASSKHGVAGIDKWLGDKPWDVIHFNFGLHDLKFVRDSETIVPLGTEGAHHQIELDAYRANLTKIIERLKQTGATLVWCNTTPVPDGANGRRPEDVEPYNRVALEIAKSHGVMVNDLNAYASERLTKIQLPKDVHFTADGSKQLAEHVAQVIQSALKSRSAQ